MKAKHLLSAFLMASLLSLSFGSCSEEEVSDNGQTDLSKPIKAVGFDTDRPVKKLIYYSPKYSDKGTVVDHEKFSEMVFTWHQNHIMKVAMNHYQTNENGESKLMGTEEYVYTYQDENIICRHVRKSTGQKKDLQAEPLEEITTIALDADGYAKNYIQYGEDAEAYVDENNMPKTITWKVRYEYAVERDANHRVTKAISKCALTYKPEDEKWLRDHNKYVREGYEDVTNFSYTKDGDVVEPGFSEFTEHENLNGFFIGSMHAFTHPRSLIPMGPFDLFHVVKTAHLPANFEHEIFKYEFDSKGYVTKIHDCREFANPETVFPYTVVEY